MNGEVTTWKMTEKERLAYIEKHPIKPIKKPKGSGYADYNWRGKKAAESRWGDKQKEGEFI